MAKHLKHININHQLQTIIKTSSVIVLLSINSQNQRSMAPSFLSELLHILLNLKHEPIEFSFPYICSQLIYMSL